MEEYGVKITYIKGSENIVADILSGYPTTNDPKVKKPIPIQLVFATNNDIPADAFPVSFQILSAICSNRTP
jgi:hypothetical protein